MSSTAKLEWWIDSREYELFREYVEEKHGVIALCFPSEVLQAMRAFIDKDRAADVEDKFATLEDALADSLPGYSRRRKSSGPLATDDLGEDDTTKIRCEVPAKLKEEFAIYVDEHSEWGYGEALGRAMNAYRDGGREQRLADALDAMTAAVESVDAENIETTQNNESDQDQESDETETRPYSREKKIEAIRCDLAEEYGKDSAEEIEQLPREQIVQAIHRYCSQDPEKDASDRTVSDYLSHITDELELTDHPQNDVLLIKDAELDGPAFEHKSYDALTTEERVEAIHVKLLREVDRNRRYQVAASDIQTGYFDGDPSDSVAHELRNRAAEAAGFGVRTARDGVQKLKVDLADVTDESLLETAGLSNQRNAEVEAAAEMDVLMDAEVATDGGTDLGST